MLSNKFVLKR